MTFTKMWQIEERREGVEIEVVVSCAPLSNPIIGKGQLSSKFEKSPLSLSPFLYLTSPSKEKRRAKREGDKC